MKRRSPEIRLTGLQIKSAEKARKLAAAIDVIETERGIRCVWLTLDNCFICPEIDWSKINRTPMQRMLGRLAMRHDKMKRRCPRKRS